MTDRTSQHIWLKDGRKFAFAEWGEPDGQSILVFNGGSGRLFQPVTDLSGLRLITVDRPGIGLSDFHSKRVLLDAPDDVIQLADALDIERFAIIGISQGTPPAAACAYKLPQRLTAVSLVSSVGPTDSPEVSGQLSGTVRLFSTLTQQFPFLAPFAASLTQAISATAIRRAPEWTYRQLLKSMLPRDRAIFENHPEHKAVFITGIADTYRQGLKGGVQEGLMAYRPWGFQLNDIQTRVYVWHGEEDEIAHPAIGRYLAKTLPNCRATFVPGAGHFIAFTHWREIVSQLIDE